MGLDKNDIRALIAILQKGLMDDDSDFDNEESLDITKPNNKKKTINKKKPERENKFLNMKEKDMFKSDVEIDRKLKVAPLTERTRQFVPINVRCRVCGKQESVNPNIVESKERYKCNKCSSSSG